MLEGKNLSYVYESGLFHTHKVEALSDVSIVLEKGKSAAIVGESGSGKTTLLKLLTLQLKPNSGEVIFDGMSTHSMSKQERLNVLRRVQLIPQNPYDAVDPRWSVEKSVTEPLKLLKSGSKTDIERTVDALFSEVGLSPGHKSRYPFELSGGELQRVVIARALSLQPDVLVCDEITSMLDVSVQAYVMSVLQEIQRKHGLSLLFVTHDLGLASAVSDYVYVMHEGRFVDEGEDVLENPKSQYSKEFVNALNYFEPMDVV